MTQETGAVFNLARINSLLFISLGQLHVSKEFIASFADFLGKKDLFTFGSQEFNNSLEVFLSSEESNRDNLFELVVSYYSNMVLDGIRPGDFYPLAQNILLVKEDLPINKNIQNLLGPLTFESKETTKGYDIFICILYLLKLQYASLADYASRP